MGGTGAQNKREGYENSSGRLLEGGAKKRKQDGEMDTRLNCDPGAAVTEFELKGNGQLNAEVSSTGGGSSNRDKNTTMLSCISCMFSPPSSFVRCPITLFQCCLPFS